MTLYQGPGGSGIVPFARARAQDVAGQLQLVADSLAEITMRIDGLQLAAGSIPQMRDIVATEGQTVFEFWAPVLAVYLDVFVNGVRLRSSEFDHAGKTVVLSSGVSEGDIVTLKGFLPNAIQDAQNTVYLNRTVADELNDGPIRVEHYGAIGNGIADDTAAFEQALVVQAEANSLRPIELRARKYRITRSLSANREIVVRGRGPSGNGTQILNDIADLSQPLFNVYAEPGTSSIGLEISNLCISTPGNYSTGYKQGGVGIRLNTAPGHIVNMGKLSDLIVNNQQLGVDIGGVFYQFDMERVRVSAFPIDPAVGMKPRGATIAGIRMGVISFFDVTYNTFRTCETTEVQNGGYGWLGSSQFSVFINCTSDGPVDITSVSGVANGFTIEGWTQDAGASPSNFALGLRRFSSMSGLVLRAVPKAKGPPIGMFFQGRGVIICPGNDGEMPDLPMYLDGNFSIIGANFSGVVNKIPATGPGGLNGSFAIDAESITDAGFATRGAQSWVPDFALWDTPPDQAVAVYSRVSDLVTINIRGVGGVIGTDDTIGGLPIQSSALFGGTATLASNDPADNFTARIWSGSNEIQHLQPRNLAGKFWQLDATYRV